MKKTILSIIIDGALYACAYFAILKANPIADNLITLYAILTCFVGFVLFGASLIKINPDHYKTFGKSGKVWETYDALTDWSMLIIFAAFGWWFTMAAILMYIVGKASMKNEIEKQKAKEATT